jgi:hypothetical protein
VDGGGREAEGKDVPDYIDILSVDFWIPLCEPDVGEHSNAQTRQDYICRTKHISYLSLRCTEKLTIEAQLLPRCI